MTGTADETTYEPDPQRWKALTVCLTAGFMTLLDVSIVNVALPSIRAGLGASDGELQWIVSGYALSFGLVLVAAGRLGDMRGRRTLFVVGVVVFTVSSMLAGIAPNPTWLVLARLLQGVGGGIINPQVSGLIQQLFRGQERGRAFGRLGTVIGISTAIGPVLGGALIAVFGVDVGWRWIFFVNVPVGALAIVLAYRYLPPSRRPTASGDRDLDPVGVLALGAGVVAILWPLVSGEAWRATDAIWIAAGLVILGGFAWWERRYLARGRAPMVDVSLFRLASYTAGATLALVYFTGFTGIFFVLTLYFQNGLGYSPLLAGVAITSFALGSAAAALIGGRLVHRFGRSLVVAGLVLFIVGILVTDTVIDRHGAASDLGWWTALPLLLAGLGSGLVISPNQTLTLAQVPIQRAGAAGGVLQTGQRLGTAAGIAAIGSLYFAGLRTTGDPAIAVSHGLRACAAITGLALLIGVTDLVRGARNNRAALQGRGGQ